MTLITKRVNSSLLGSSCADDEKNNSHRNFKVAVSREKAKKGNVSGWHYQTGETPWHTNVLSPVYKNPLIKLTGLVREVSRWKLMACNSLETQQESRATTLIPKL